MSMHVLFVDDTPDILELFTLYFTMKGHTVETASAGLEALRVAAKNRKDLDLIILDYRMEGMDGIEVAQHLQQVKEIASVPVILFTNDHQIALEDKADMLGIARVVYKNVLPNRLLEVAEEIVVKTASLPTE